MAKVWPLFGLVFAFASNATEVQLGDWKYYTVAPFYATTVNESGGLFGQRCNVDEGSCNYIMVMSEPCERDDRIPVIVNSVKSFVSTTLQCVGPLTEGKYIYNVGDFADVDSMVREAPRIALAFPSEGDSFKVVRFSMRGAIGSLDRMRAAAEKALDEVSKQPTRDLRL